MENIHIISKYIEYLICIQILHIYSVPIYYKNSSFYISYIYLTCAKSC